MKLELLNLNGWLKLHRILLANPIFNSEPFTKGQAWVTLLMLTNSKEGLMPIKNGEMIKIMRGECGLSELALADIFKWSRGKVKRFLNLLESEKMIHQKNRSNRTIIEVINYENYQNGTVNDTVNDTVNGTVNDTVNGHNIRNKEYKNIRNNMYDEKFLEFYNLYPRKVEKQKAHTAYLKAIKKVSHEEIMQGVQNYIDEINYKKTESQYIKHPSTWLNAGCWEDNYENETNKQEEFDYDTMPYNPYR